jgi:RNA polymerase sigma factor (sigma-70 family)
MTEGSARLAEVFEREKSRLLGYVRRQLAGFSGAEAEDIVSDAVYNLLRRADVIGEIENLTAYLYRSVANRITDHRRGGAPPLSLDHPARLSAEETGPLDPEHAGPTPEQSYDQAQLRERLAEALDQLGPRERAIWIATEVDGRSFRELAEDWGEPIGTLLSRKSRASGRLRDLLSDYRTRTQELP